MINEQCIESWKRELATSAKIIKEQAEEIARLKKLTLDLIDEFSIE